MFCFIYFCIYYVLFVTFFILVYLVCLGFFSFSFSLSIIFFVLTFSCDSKTKACWFVSNLASIAGDDASVECLASAHLFGPLVELLTFGEFDIKQECAWALRNCVVNGNERHRNELLALNFLSPFCTLLAADDQALVAVALDGITSLLEHATEPADMALAIEEVGGVEHLERLLTTKNDAIYNRASALLEQYFIHEDDEDEDEDES